MKTNTKNHLDDVPSKSQFVQKTLSSLKTSLRIRVPRNLSLLSSWLALHPMADMEIPVNGPFPNSTGRMFRERNARMLLDINFSPLLCYKILEKIATNF